MHQSSFPVSSRYSGMPDLQMPCKAEAQSRARLSRDDNLRKCAAPCTSLSPCLSSCLPGRHEPALSRLLGQYWLVFFLKPDMKHSPVSNVHIDSLRWNTQSICRLTECRLSGIMCQTQRLKRGRCLQEDWWIQLHGTLAGKQAYLKGQLCYAGTPDGHRHAKSLALCR